MKEFIDLTKVLKIGYSINDITQGEKQVVDIRLGIDYPISMTDGTTYTKDGKYNTGDVYPSIYRNKQELQVEYEPEQEQEIDWSKVPRNTMVLCGDDNIEMDTPRYFSDFTVLALNYKFRVYTEGKKRDYADSIIEYKQCIIHPSVKIKKKWYKGD